MELLGELAYVVLMMAALVYGVGYPQALLFKRILDR